MNRRTVLRSAGVVTLAGLAGCVDSIESHFQGGIQGVVPLEITHEGEQPQNVQLEAYELETDRQTYDEGYTVNVGERVAPPHLEAIEQRFRATRFEDANTGSVDTARISPETKLVRIRLYDDDIDIELIFDEAEAENVTDDVNTDEDDSAADEDDSAADN